MTTFAKKILQQNYEPVSVIFFEGDLLTWTSWTLVTGAIYSVSKKNTPITKTNRILQDSTELIQVFSYAALVAGTFFDDVDNDLVYVWLYASSDPAASVMQIQNLFGYRMGGNRAYFANSYLEDCLSSVPQFSKTKSNLFDSKVIFEGGQVKFRNQKGIFDSLNLMGKNVTMYLGFDDIPFSEFHKMFNGFVESGTLTKDELSLSLKDDKRKINKNIPELIFDPSVYPYLKDENQNKPIPMAYGMLYGIPVICTNEEEPAASTFHFKLADTRYHSIKAITTVYVEGVSVAFSNTDLANATFDLSSAVFAEGQAVTADIQGYESGGVLISNGLDILKDILVNNFGLANNANNFDAFRWHTIRAFDSQLFLNESKNIFESITPLVLSSLVNFVKEDSGQWAARIFYGSANTDQKILKSEIIGNPTLKFDTTKIITSVDVKYAKNYDTDKSLTYPYNVGEAALSALLNGVLKKGDYDTNLTTAANAQAFALKIMEIYGSIYAPFDIDTSFVSIEREIDDVCEVELSRPFAPEQGNWKCEILGVKKNIDKGTVTLTCRPYQRVLIYALDVSDTYYKDANYYNWFGLWNYILYGDCENDSSPTLDTAPTFPFGATWTKSSTQKKYGNYSRKLLNLGAIDGYTYLHRCLTLSEQIELGDCENASSPTLDGGTYGLSGATWARSSTQKHAGTYSWVLTNSGADQGYVWLCDNNSGTDLHGLIPGQTYTFSCWVWNNTTLPTNCYIALTQAGGAAPHNDVLYPSLSSTWELLTITFTLNSDATGFNIFVDMGTNNSGKTLYLDDISLSSYDLSTTDNHGLIPNTTYNISAWAFTSAASPANSKIVFGQYYSGAWHTTDIVCTSTNTWHQITGTVAINSTCTGTYLEIINLAAAGAGTTFYIDDLKLYPTPVSFEGSEYEKTYERYDLTKN